jgi:hypothetical protein
MVIRPDLRVLSGLPTIHQVAEAWGKLELKLETDDTRYWLTTEGVPQQVMGTPINYVLNYVTVEKRGEDGNWDLRAVYSPDTWKLSQGFDYARMLHRDLARLSEEQEEGFSWERAREIANLRRELATVNEAIFELAEKVRFGW